MSSALTHPNISLSNGSSVAGKSKQVKLSTLAVAGTRLTNPIRSYTQIQSQTLLQTKYSCRDPLIQKDNMFEQEVLDNELKVLMERLKTVVERVRVMEVEKFMCRTKGEISSEDRDAVKKMSTEIVDKFLEKTIQYLQCKGNGNLACKLKDLKFLVGAIEGSCSRSSKEQPVCKRDLYFGIRDGFDSQIDVPDQPE